MRVLNIIIILFLTVLPLSAQEVGIDAVSSSADGVSTYMPVVRMLCFSIAGVIAIVGAYTTYYAFHQGQDVQKRVMMTVGSAMTFLTMAIFLPKFFGYDDNGFDTTGLIAQNGGGGVGDSGTGTSSMAGDTPGVPGSGIDATIPDINDPKWSEQHSPSELLAEHGQVTTQYNGKQRVEMDDFLSEYTFYMNPSPSSYLAQARQNYNRYQSDIDVLLMKHNYDFNAAAAEALSQYEYICEWEENNDPGPYTSGDYWRIYQTIEALQQISCDVTWWRYSGEVSPPSIGWTNTFFP